MIVIASEMERDVREAPIQPDAEVDSGRMAAAERIVGSQNFSKSGRLNAFLLHIVRCTVEGRTDELTEQQIGVQVFGRMPGYNPSEDNIVRTTARQLRQRLALYYQEEGFADSIRIQVPRGGYIPVFSSEQIPALPTSPAEDAAAPSVVPAPVLENAAPAVTASRGSRHLWRYAVALLLGVGLTVLVDLGPWQQQHHPAATAADPIWAEIFAPGRTTIFVPGDAGLNLYNIYSARTQPLSLSEYINSTPPQPIQLENLANRKVYPEGLMAYIPISDLMLGDRLSRLAASRPGEYEIRLGQRMSSSDFRDTNAILSGAPPYDPWVELFDAKLNFHFLFNGIDHSMQVVNLHPRPGEQASYLYDQNPDHPLGYGYIALTDNLEGNGKVLLIEGTSLIGVDAAVSFLFNDKKMAPIMAEAKRDHGSLANFEVLVKAPFLKLNAGDVNVVATRFYPNN